MSNLPAIQEQHLNSLRRLSLEEIEQLFHSRQEYCGFFIMSLEHNYEWLEKLELYQATTGITYKLSGPRKWCQPEPGPIIEGTIEHR